MTGSPPAASCILGRRTASMSNTQGGSRVPKLGLLGSVRGVRSNAHPYRKQNRSIAVLADHAEQRGKEVGFYQEPASDFGRLTSELFRAVRLVVDTGIHAKGWTRDQVVDYMRKTGAADEPSIQFETDRYIAWPAQALSYKLGQLKIIELRARAQRALGSHFDVRRFHDEILSGGVLPLELLDEVTDRWIRAQTIATRSADGRTTNQSSTTSQQ